MAMSTNEEDEYDTDEIRDGEGNDDDAVDDPEGEAELNVAPPPLGALPVLVAIQLVGEAGATVEEIQRELVAADAGEHPRGVIWAVLMGIVEAGKLRQEGATEVDARFWVVAAETPEQVRARRHALVLTALSGGPEFFYPLGHLISDAGYSEDTDRAEVEVEALVAESLLDTEEEDGALFFGLNTEHSKSICALGVTAWLAPAADAKIAAPPADRSQFERNVEDLYEKERAARLIAEARMSKVEAWLKQNGLSVGAILDPEVKAEVVTGEPYPFSESRPVNDAERGLMWKERIALEEKKALAGAQLDAHKADYKALAQTIDGQIAALIAEDHCDKRVVVIPARKVPDWAKKVFRILAVDDGRELSTEPMPRGTQRPLLPVDAAAPVVDSAAAPGAIAEFKIAFAEKTGAPPPAADPAPVEAAVVVDLATLSTWEKKVYLALEAEGCAVAGADLAARIQALDGKVLGNAAAMKVFGAATDLADRGVIAREGDGFRLFGAPAVKAPVVADTVSRVEALLRSAGMLTTGEIAQRLAITADEVKSAFAELKRRSALTSDDGKTRAKRYGIAGAATQAQA